MKELLESIQIKRCTFEDIPDIANVHVASWGEAYRGLLPQNFLDGLNVQAWQRTWERIFREESGKDSHVIIAYLDGDPVGFISFGPARDEMFVGMGEIYAIYLIKDVWGLGVGYCLFLEAQTALKGSGFRGSYLWMIETNKKALNSYIRWGGSVDDHLYKLTDIAEQKIREIVVQFI